MNIHHCFQDIKKKKQSVTDGHTDGPTDNAKTVYPTTNKEGNLFTILSLYGTKGLPRSILVSPLIK